MSRFVFLLPIGSALKDRQSLTRSVACIFAAILLAGCEGEQITTTNVVGIYYADVPAERLRLVVKSDGTWDYQIEDKLESHRTGKWIQEPKWSTRSTIVLSFADFDFGFPLSDTDPKGLRTVYFPFERAGNDRFRACLSNLGQKWGPQGRLCFAKE
jgi:hypothetical protein